MPEKEDKIEGFKTACSSCIFATYNKQQDLMQIGCELGRLEKFQQQGRAFLDEPKTAYLIDGICTTCRGPKWLDRQAGKDTITAVLQEVRLAVDVVLYSVDDICDNLNWKIGQAVQANVKQHKIPPKKLVIVVKSDRAKFSELYDTIQDLCESYEIPFQLVRVMEDDADVGRCIEMGIDKCSSQFTAVFDVDSKIPNNFIHRFDDIINHQLRRVLMIEPITSYNGLIFATNLFAMLGKNYNTPIFQKVKEVVEDQRKEHLIITWSDL